MNFYRIFIILFCILFSSIGYCEDITVFFTKGETYSVSIKGQKTKLSKGSSLVEGDTIITGKKSLLILKIAGHSTHKIEENSEVYIDQLLYRFEKSRRVDQGANLFLKAGAIFSEVTKTRGKKSLTIETKNTTMGVRGTQLLVSVDRKSQDVLLAVKTGEVEIKNHLSGQKDIIGKKQGIFLPQDSSLTQPKRYKWIQQISWNLKNKKKFTSSDFSKRKKMIYKEVRKKKAPWIRNEVLFKQKEQKWEIEKLEYKKMVKDLKPMALKSKRKDSLKKFTKKMIKKEPKDLASGVNNKSKLKKNSFADKSLKFQSRREKLRQQARARALERMKRRRLRRYRPGQVPSTIPQAPSVSNPVPTIPTPPTSPSTGGTNPTGSTP